MANLVLTKLGRFRPALTRTGPRNIHIMAQEARLDALLAGKLLFFERLRTHAESLVDLLETLDSGGPVGWIRKRTDTWKLGYRIVDPDREMFADDPVVSELSDVHHAMLAIDLHKL